MTYLHADFQYGFSQIFLIINDTAIHSLEYMLKINCSFYLTTVIIKRLQNNDFGLKNVEN